MPTYDYRCPNGHDFEHFYRKISDATGELACPTCGAIATRQLSAGAGLVFKGSGFYLTDYGKNAHRKSGSDAPSSSTEAKSESSGSDSKPASKTESNKSESGSTSPKSDAPAASASKSDSSKGSETKPISSKPKGGEST